MARLPNRLLGWVFLALYCLCGATWGRGLVLCFEPDGHVSLEAATDCSSCCSAGEGSAASVSACPCSDVPISLAEPGQVKLGLVPVDVPRSARWLGTVTGGAAHVRCCPRSNELPRSHASSALASLRCVVLLV